MSHGSLGGLEENFCILNRISILERARARSRTTNVKTEKLVVRHVGRVEGQSQKAFSKTIEKLSLDSS